jgi:hypothetical protein
MFIKLYSYQLRRRDLRKWRSIVRQASRVYAEYGADRFLSAITTKGSKVSVVEFNIYPSKGDYRRVTRDIDQDRRITLLFREFKKIVPLRSISQVELTSAHSIGI